MSIPFRQEPVVRIPIIRIVVAGLVPATPIVLAACPIFEVAGTSPATTAYCLQSEKKEAVP